MSLSSSTARRSSRRLTARIQPRLETPSQWVRRRRAWTALSVAVGAALMSMNAAHAVDLTWDGGGSDANWSTLANWDDGFGADPTLPPATGDNLTFGGSLGLATVNDLTGLTLGNVANATAISFNTSAGSFNLSGNSFIVGINSANTGFISQSSTANQIISNNITLAGGGRDRNIAFNGTGLGSITLSGNINFANDIVGLGRTATTNTNAGTLILTGNNSGDGRGAQIVSGGNALRAVIWTPVDDARLVIGSDSALGNVGTGDANAGTGVLRGIVSSRRLFISTLGGPRNLSGHTFGITGGRVDFDGPDNLTIGNVINSGGNRDLWVTGPGKLTVASNIFLSNDTTGRNLFFNVTGAGGAEVNGAIHDTFNNTAGTYATMTTFGQLRKAGAGLLTLNGDSSFRAEVRVEGGTLKMGHANALGASDPTLYLTSIRAGTLDLNGFSTAERITVDNSAAVLANTSATASVLSNNITLNGNLVIDTTGDITIPRLTGAAVRTITKRGAGTLTTNGAGVNNLTAWNIEAGTVIFANAPASGSALAADRGVTLSGGTLRLSGPNSNLINDTQPFTINSGTFDLNGKGEAVAAIAGTGGLITNSAAASSATLFVGGGVAGTNSASYAGVIENGAGTLSLTKEGTGTQTLTAVHTYTGPTTITNGTLAIDGTIASSVTATSNAARVGTLAGNGTVNGAVNIGDGAIIAPGNNGVGNLTLGSDLNLNPTASLLWQFDNAGTLGTAGTNYDLITMTGAGSTLGLAGTINVSLLAGDYSGAFWDSPQSFTAINVANATGTLGSIAVVATGSAGQGTFTTSLSNGDVILNWVPVAGNSIWIGAAGSSWNNPANWQGGSVPLSNFNTDFGSAGAGGIVNLDAPTNLADPMTLSLANGSGGSYDIASGTGGSLVLNGQIAVNVGVSGESHTISAPVTGPGSLNKIGAGSLVLSGNNAYAGSTTITGGTLVVGQSSALPASTGLTLTSSAALDLGGNNVTVASLTGAGGEIRSTNPATLTVNQSVNSSYDGTMSGAVGLIKSGPGVLTLTGSNTYTGNTRLNAGTVLLPNNQVSAFGTGTLTLASSSATTPILVVTPSNGAPTSNAVFIPNDVVVQAGTTNVIDNSASAFGNLWLGGSLSGSGTLVMQNSNASTSQGQASSALLFLGSKLGSFNGTIRLESSNPIGRAFAFIANADANNPAVSTFDASQTAWVLGSNPTGGSGIIKWNNSEAGPVTARLGSLAGVASASRLEASNVAATTFEIGALNTSTTYAGTIVNAASPNTGVASLTKVGTGTLTLTGANTYTGVTRVAGGNLVLSVAGGAAQPVLGGASVASPAGADINRGRLIFDYTAATSPASQIAALLDAGFDANFTPGPGRLLFSTGTINTEFSLGWFDNTAENQVIVAYTLLGDTNADLLVNFTDLLAVARNYNTTGTVWSQGDFNYDGLVGFADLLALARNYNRSTTLTDSFEGDWALALSLVPEPTTLTALVGVAAVGLRRRRR